MRRFLVGAVVLFLVGLSVSSARAEMVFQGMDSTSNTAIKIDQHLDAGAGLVRIVIQLKCDFEFDTIAGGFQAIAPAEFSNPVDDVFRTSAELAANKQDTAFFGDPDFIFQDVDNSNLLYVNAAAYTGPTGWPGSNDFDNFFEFAQLVLPTSGQAGTVNEQIVVVGSLKFSRKSVDVATLTGTVTAVPEPSSIALIGIGLLGVGLITYRRRS